LSTAALLCVAGIAGIAATPAAAAKSSTISAASVGTVAADSVSGQLAYVAVGGAFGVPNALAVMDTRTDSIVDLSTLTQALNGIAVNPAGTRVYGTSQGALAVIDPATDATLGTIAVGGSNGAVAIDPSGTRAYVADSSGTGSIHIVDTAAQTVTATIPAGGNGLALSADGTRLYTTGVGGVLSVIDTGTDTVVASVACGTAPGGVALDGTGAHAYVTDWDTGSLYVVDTATDSVTAAIALNGNRGPTGVVVNSAGTTAYVADGPGGQVLVVDLQSDTVTKTLSAGVGVMAEAINAAGTRLYVGASNATMTPRGSVTAFDTAGGTVSGGIGVTGWPSAIALGPTSPGTAVSLTTTPTATATHGTPVTLTATVSGADSGTVQFYDRATLAFGAVPLGAPVPVTNGTATLSTTSLTVDTHSLSAAFTPAQPGLLRSASSPATVQVIPSGINVDQTVGQNGTGKVTTAPLSTTGPRLLLAFAGSDGPSANQSTTVTGAGLTWTLVRRANHQGGTAEIWSAFAPGPLTGDTVTSTPRFGGYDQQLTVLAITGATTVGASATSSGSAGVGHVSVTTTASGSQVFGVGEDYSSAQSRTAASGQWLPSQWVDTAVGDTFWTQSTYGPTSAAGTAVTLSDTAPTGDIWNMAAVEVVASGQ
jgi:YVTN family beta-propeller protein